MEPNRFVTIRFERLSPDSRSNLDGFFIRYGCAGNAGSDRSCRESPVLLMTSNLQQAAACDRHLLLVLNTVIDGVLRLENGERRNGFLTRSPTPKAPSREPTSMEATDEVVWQNRLDGRYDVIVFRSKEPYNGVLIVRDGLIEISRTQVGLSYDAMIGPDAGDVQTWIDAAIAVVDQSKSPSELINEAIRRTERERKNRIDRLQASPNVGAAYRIALDVYRQSEAAVHWLISPNVALNGKAPTDILDDQDGVGRIRELLTNVVKTIYPLS